MKIKTLMIFLSLFVAHKSILSQSTLNTIRSIHNKREISFTISCFDSIPLNVGMLNLSVYAFKCNGNVLNVNSSNIISTDSIFKIDFSSTDSSGVKKILVPKNHILKFRIDRNQRLKIKKSQQVIIIINLNGNAYEINSKYYRKKFCHSKRPPIPEAISLLPN